MADALSPVGALVRAHDPDRFFTALFAPPGARETLFVLYAFNHELARAREAARQPTLALIRLQWWREVVGGEARRHEVATPLGEAIGDGRLARDDLLAMIEGREAETEPAIATTAAWRAYLDATAGALAVAAGHALGAAAALDGRIRALGSAYGVAGQLRSIAALARQERCVLPEDVLGQHGLTPDAVIEAPEAAALRPVRAALAEAGRAMLAEGAGRFSRPVIAAALPAVLARRDLRSDDPAPGARGIGARMAVMIAASRRRV